MLAPLGFTSRMNPFTDSHSSPFAICDVISFKTKGVVES